MSWAPPPSRAPKLTPSLVAKCVGLLDALAVQGDIETLALLLLGHPQPEGLVDHGQDRRARDEAVDERREDPFQLREQRAVDPTDLLADEHPREQCADDAADPMHAESVERIVVAEGMLEGGGRVIANDSGRSPDEDRR